MIEIAPFSSTFQADVIDVILPIQREEFGFPSAIENQPDLLDIPNFYQSGAGGFWIALDGGRVVGTIALRDIGNLNGALRKMFVRATHRGKEYSVAGQLLGHLVDASKGRLSNIFLGTTERYLAAHRFYEKNGFTRIPESALPATFPRVAASTRFYQLKVPE
ncbi:GNAT family N-acetyltransferase [Variovorax sp. LT2P21]|uniref:GNAT family N-acetyltransferase n=1 Tax=Variovorax sp. LT2P21 TaxID=3443731 RepID=UPI003F450A86